MASSMRSGKAGVLNAPDDAGSMDQLVSCQPPFLMSFFICATRPVIRRPWFRDPSSVNPQSGTETAANITLRQVLVWSGVVWFGLF